MNENDNDWEYPNYWHFFVSSWNWENGIFDPIIRLVADDEIRNLMIVNIYDDFLYHPYDGGADVILRSSVERNRLKSRHTEWLPTPPSEL